MKKKLFYGTGVALITPFKQDKTVDFESLGRIVSHCIDGNVDYFVVLGTTGESVTLSHSEKQQVVRYVTEQTKGKIPIVIGIGGNDTAGIIDTIKQTDFSAIAGILSVAPYYNKPTQAGIIAHFKAIAAASPVPVILYNIPGRTGINMTVETTLELAQETNIAGIKEASGILSQMMKIIAGKPEDFVVISGDDVLTLPLIAAGGGGVISVAANAYPHEMSALVTDALTGNFTQAREHHYRLLPLFEAQIADGNPAGIKAALHIMGKVENVLRLPLVPVSAKIYEQIELIVKGIGSEPNYTF
ncbi:MAG: 4-hydroxy-tetrahydrodipicolinate synthase [Bacteroidales bacterium]|jgi:4-hydroxy-tetrahydrodipicolinate synthase|nr:4-hydroxy-tetrahydrodipicolinate synthase [Bacteroidales bacterium]